MRRHNHISDLIMLCLGCIFLSIAEVSAQNDYDPDSPPEPGTVSLITLSNPANEASVIQSGSGVYMPNAEVTVEAIPSDDYNFSAWMVDGKVVSEDLKYTFTIKQNTRLIASLAYYPDNLEEPGSGKYNLITTANPELGGWVEQSGSGRYLPQEQVTLTTYPHREYEFKHWESEGVVLSDQPTYTFKMPAKRKRIQAIYSWNPNAPGEPGAVSLYLRSNNSEAGYISQSGSGSYQPGQKVVITASPYVGYKFNGWYNGTALLASGLSYRLTIQKDTTITARFSVSSCTITLDTTSCKNGKMKGDSVFVAGQRAKVEAIPDEGYAFEGWYIKGVLVDTAQMNYSFIVTSNLTLVAKFREIPFTLKLEGVDAKVASVTLLRGNIAHLSAKPVKNMAFKGWYKGEALLSTAMEYDYNILLKSETVITAKYVKSIVANESIQQAPAYKIHRVDDVLLVSSEKEMSEIKLYDFFGRLLVHIKETDFSYRIEERSKQPCILFIQFRNGERTTCKMR